MSRARHLRLRDIGVDDAMSKPVPEPRLRPSRDAAVLVQLSWLDRLLPVWILLAMGAGLLLGRMVPGLQALLGAVQVDHTSLPIAVGLLLMMDPLLAKVRYGELSSMARDRRLLTLTLGLTWGVGALLMFSLAWLFLPDQPAFRTGLILIARAVLIFLGIPLVAGFLTRLLGVRLKGLRWYEQVFLPRIGPWPSTACYSRSW